MHLQTERSPPKWHLAGRQGKIVAVRSQLLQMTTTTTTDDLIKLTCSQKCLCTTKLAFPWPPPTHAYNTNTHVLDCSKVCSIMPILLLVLLLWLLRVSKQNWVPGPGTWSNIHSIVMDKRWRAEWIDWIVVEIELWVAVAVHLPFSIYNFTLFFFRAFKRSNKVNPKKIQTFWFSAFIFRLW